MRGFTLIEVLLYISLYGMLMGGVLNSVASIRESAARTEAKALLLQEGAPLLQTLERYASDGSDMTMFRVENDSLIQRRDAADISISDPALRIQDLSIIRSNPAYTDILFTAIRETETGSTVRYVFSGRAYRNAL